MSDFSFDADDWLNRDDYIDYWVANARSELRRQDRRHDCVTEAISIICGTFGREWLEEAARSSVPLNRMDSDKNHPLGSSIASVSTKYISEVIELALYLRTLFDVPGIGQVTTALRSPTEYPSAFLQLALAYRFRSLGATELELEPPVADGRIADIAFRYRGRRFVVECFVPRFPGRQRELVTLGMGANKIDFKKERRVPLVHFSLKDPKQLTPAVRKSLLHTAREMIRSGESERDLPHCFIEILDSTGHGSRPFELEPLLKLSDDQQLFSVSTQDVASARELKEDFETAQRVSVGRVAVSGPRDDFDVNALVASVTGKLKKKTSQLRTDDDSVGVFAVETWLGTSPDANFDCIHDDVLAPYGLAFAMLLDRGFKSEIDIAYGGAMIGGDPTHGPYARQLADHFSQVEAARIILNEWQE
ncbi:MAG: hypothetical protein AAFZ38_05670 [Myxococcota bacterium]